MSRKLIETYLVSVSLFHAFFVYLMDGTMYGRIIQLLAISVCSLYAMTHWRTFFIRRFVSLNIIVSLLGVWICMSWFFSRSIVVSEPLSSFALPLMTSVGLLAAAICIEDLSLRGRGGLLLKSFFYVAAFYSVLSILNIPLADLSTGTGFLIGTKFEVAYMVMFTALLYLCTHPYPTKNNRIIFLILAAFSLLFSMLVHCSTSMIGVCVVVLIWMTGTRGFRFFRKASSFLIVLIICDSILLVFQSVLQIPVVTYFIENVLDKDVTLTNRVVIYARAPLLIYERLFTGYGFGNSFPVCMYYIKAPNCQNGVLDLALQIGVVGVFLLIISILSYIKKSHIDRRNYGVLLMLYFYVVVSSVEITITPQQLVLAMLLLTAITNKRIRYAR